MLRHNKQEMCTTLAQKQKKRQTDNGNINSARHGLAWLSLAWLGLPLVWHYISKFLYPDCESCMSICLPVCRAACLPATYAEELQLLKDSPYMEAWHNCNNCIRSCVLYDNFFVCARRQKMPLWLLSVNTEDNCYYCIISALWANSKLAIKFVPYNKHTCYL